jgi:hypothetical protein
LRDCTSRYAVLALLCAAAAQGCTSDPASPSGGGNAPQLTAPAVDAPSDDEQLSTLRPTLVVRNGTSSATGSRTYEFQLSTSDTFAAINLSRGGIAESASGKTSFAVDSDLQSTTRYYWRARVSQGSSNSDWSSMGRFKTKAVGYNRPGELYDPLVAEETVGERFGSTTFVAGKGLTLNSAASYVRYALPATVSAGEFSMEIEGLRPNGSVAGKPRLFSMLNGTGRLDLSKYQMNVQYRGSQGNPDNAIAFKAVWGDDDMKLEPDLGERQQSVRILDPGRTYFWQATWNALTFRLVVREDGPAGTVIYDRSETSSPGYGPYAPVPHFAYLGANEAALGGEDGTFTNMTIRNVWLGDKPRPASLGSALRVQ